MAKKINARSNETSASTEVVALPTLESALRTSTVSKKEEINELQDAVHVEAQMRLKKIRSLRDRVYQRTLTLNKERQEVSLKLKTAWQNNLQKALKDYAPSIKNLLTTLRESGFLTQRTKSSLDDADLRALSSFTGKTNDEMDRSILDVGGYASTLAYLQMSSTISPSAWLDRAAVSLEATPAAAKSDADDDDDEVADAAEDPNMLRVAIVLYFNPVFSRSRGYGNSDIQSSVEFTALSGKEHLDIPVPDTVIELLGEFQRLSAAMGDARSHAEQLRQKELNAAIAVEEAILKFRCIALQMSESGKVFMKQAAEFLDSDQSLLGLQDIEELEKTYRS